jgi:hypothetical protein
LHLYAEQSVHLTEHNGKMWTFFSFLLPFDLREFAAHDSGLFKRWSSFWRNLNLASAAICHWHYIRLILRSFLSFFLSFFFLAESSKTCPDYLSQTSGTVMSTHNSKSEI